MGVPFFHNSFQNSEFLLQTLILLRELSMKWVLPLILFSSSTFACVDLTGVYAKCVRVQGYSTTLNDGGFTIYKPEANGIEYHINGRIHLANNLSRTAPPSETGNDTDLEVSDSCNETSLTHFMRDSEVEIQYSFEKREQALLVTVKAKAPYDHINDIFVCQ